jgi:hypothetical protein
VALAGTAKGFLIRLVEFDQFIGFNIGVCCSMLSAVLGGRETVALPGVAGMIASLGTPSHLHRHRLTSVAARDFKPVTGIEFSETVD